MLGKLIKYDLKATSRLIIPVTIIAIILGIVSRILFGISIENTNDYYYSSNFDIVSIFAGTAVLISFFMIFILSIVTFWNIVSNFWGSLIGDEGYLYHTLPVKSSDLVLSKLITANIWQILFAVIIILFIISGFSLFPEDALAQIFSSYDEIIKELTAEYEYKPILIVLLYLIAILIGYNLQYIIVFLSMTTGQLVSKHKKIMSILCYIGITTGIQIISQILTSMFLVNTNNIITNETTIDPINSIIIILLMVILFSLALAIGLFMCTCYIFKNKLNLE